MEAKLEAVERSISTLGETLSRYSQETKKTLQERFAEIDRNLLDQKQINSDLRTSLDQVNTQIYQLGEHRDKQSKKEREIESDDDVEVEGKKEDEKRKSRDLRKKYEKTRDETESDSNSGEEEKRNYRDLRKRYEKTRDERESDSEEGDMNRYASKPSSSTRHSHLINAYKHNKLLIRDPPKLGGNGIEAWLTGSLAKLSKAFPQLPGSELIEIVSSRLPVNICNAVDSCDMTNTDKFINTITSLYNNREGGEEETRRQFYGYDPSNKTVLEICTDLTTLSKGIPFTSRERHKAVNKMFTSLVPYPHKSELDRQLATLGEAVPVIELLTKVYQNPQMLEAIEKEFQTAPQKAKVKQVKNTRDGTTAKQGKKGEQKRERCLRCGSYNHISEQCPIYEHTAVDFCDTCRNVTGFKHYHSNDECILKKAQEKN